MKPTGEVQVFKRDREAVKTDFQGLVSDGMDLDVALEEAIQAHLPVVVEDEISGGSDLQAMYHTLEEVLDTCKVRPILTLLNCTTIRKTYGKYYGSPPTSMPG